MSNSIKLYDNLTGRTYKSKGAAALMTERSRTYVDNQVGKRFKILQDLPKDWQRGKPAVPVRYRCGISLQEPSTARQKRQQGHTAYALKQFSPGRAEDINLN